MSDREDLAARLFDARYLQPVRDAISDALDRVESARRSRPRRTGRPRLDTTPEEVAAAWWALRDSGIRRPTKSDVLDLLAIDRKTLNDRLVEWQESGNAWPPEEWF